MLRASAVAAAFAASSNVHYWSAAGQPTANTVLSVASPESSNIGSTLSGGDMGGSVGGGVGGTAGGILPPGPVYGNGGDTYYYSQGHMPQCPQTICTDRELECQTYCKRYETGCAKECALYKTKYYEERMEPIIEKVNICLDVETHEFTQCVEWEMEQVMSCAKFEQKTINTCKRFETGVVAQCKAYDMICNEECVEYEMKEIEYCKQMSTKIEYLNIQEEKWWGDEKFPKKQYGSSGYGYSSAYRRDTEAHAPSPSPPLSAPSKAAGNPTNPDKSAPSSAPPLPSPVINGPGAFPVDSPPTIGPSTPSTTASQASLPPGVGNEGSSFDPSNSLPTINSSDFPSHKLSALLGGGAGDSFGGSTGGGAGGNTGDGDGYGYGNKYDYDSLSVHAEYGGHAVVTEKLPLQKACCKQYCAEKDCIKFPTPWCKRKSTVCHKSAKCMEYEYRYYDTNRCAEWGTKVVQTGVCIQEQPISYNTGRCIKWEKKLFQTDRCQRWGHLKYVSDQVQSAHIPYHSDECEALCDEPICWQTAVCAEYASTCYPSTQCSAWGQCLAPKFPPPYKPHKKYRRAITKGNAAPLMSTTLEPNSADRKSRTRRSYDNDNEDNNNMPPTPAYSEYDTDDEEDRRSLNFQAPPSSAQTFEAYGGSGSYNPGPPPSSPQYVPVFADQYRRGYKYYDTGYGVYNNFAYGTDKYEPLDLDDGDRENKNAFRDWIHRVKEFKDAKKNCEEPENPPFYLVNPNQDKYGPWVEGYGPKALDNYKYGTGIGDDTGAGKPYNKHYKPPSPPRPIVPVRVIHNGGDGNHHGHHTPHGPHDGPYHGSVWRTADDESAPLGRVGVNVDAMPRPNPPPGGAYGAYD